MLKQSPFHRNQSRLWRMKESIGVSVYVCVCVLVGVFWSHPPPMVLKLFHRWMFTCPPAFPGPKSPGKMGMTNFRKGDPNFFRPKPFRRGPYFEKVKVFFYPTRFGTRRKWSDNIQTFSASYFSAICEHEPSEATKVFNSSRGGMKLCSSQLDTLTCI